MYVIKVRNVNQALPRGLLYLEGRGELVDSRNGPVLRAPGPVCTVYERPWERVLFSPVRDANPFFHLMEALWMLAGRSDVKFLEYYVARMQEFSDNGTHFHGAYGFRWRLQWGVDQLDQIVEMLRTDPTTRRAVLAMWDPSADLATPSKDIPCNTHAYFSLRSGRLCMTVSCRSNDVVWGAYGANAVHFSILQEYLASRLHVEMGPFTQISNDFHMYIKRPDVEQLREKLPALLETSRRYEEIYPETVKLMEEPLEWEYDLMAFMSGDVHLKYANPFFIKVALPMRASHQAYKEGNMTEARIRMADVEDVAWRIAGSEWLQRRAK